MRRMKKHLPLIILLFGILQPLSGALAPALGIGTPIGNATRDMTLPEQPLPVFFSIWSVIFLGYFLFGLAYWRAGEPWMDRIAIPLAWAGLFNIVWMLSAQLIASQPLDFLLLFPIHFSNLMYMINAMIPLLPLYTMRHLDVWHYL